MSNIPEISRLVPKEKKGLIVVITGNGKGKTTSALGMAVRASGYDMSVSIIQFMKGDLYAGEWDGIKKLGDNVELISTGKGFCGIQGNPYSHEEHRENAQSAIKLRLVDLAQFLSIIKGKPHLMHLVLTACDAHPEIIELADTVSEVNEIKHAYRKEIEPQPGIDY